MRYLVRVLIAFCLVTLFFIIIAHPYALGQCEWPAPGSAFSIRDNPYVEFNVSPSYYLYNECPDGFKTIVFSDFPHIEIVIHGNKNSYSDNNRITFKMIAVSESDHTKPIVIDILGSVEGNYNVADGWNAIFSNNGDSVATIELERDPNNPGILPISSYVTWYDIGHFYANALYDEVLRYKVQSGASIIDLPESLVVKRIVPLHNDTTNFTPYFDFLFRNILPVHIFDSSITFGLYSDQLPEDSLIIYHGGEVIDSLMLTVTYDSIEQRLRVDWPDSGKKIHSGKYWLKVSGSYSVSPWSFRNTAIDTFTVFIDTLPPYLNVQSFEYVNPIPWFYFKSEDNISGIGLNTDSVFIDLYKVTNFGDGSLEQRHYLKRLGPSDMDLNYENVIVNTGVQLQDGQALDAWIFNGEPFDSNLYITRAIPYPDSLGIMDWFYNHTSPVIKRFYVDGMPPHIRMSPNSTHQTLIFEISDTSSTLKFESISSSIIDTTVLCSGVNTGSAKLYENFQIVSPDSTKYSSSTGVYTIYYSPSSENVWLMLDVADKVGNKSNFKNYYEDDQLSLVNPHNYPNPFSPVSPIVDQRRTIIDPGLTRTTDMEISISIYDLAGHYVATVEPVQTSDKIIGYWDGKNEDGTLVANGVYLCYIQVRDTAKNKSLSEVIKIAVAKNDERIF